MTNEQVLERINALVSPPQPIASTSRLPLYDPMDFVVAQFYIDELDRREKQKADEARDEIERQRWQTDLKYERWIVGLIVLEVILAIGFRLVFPVLLDGWTGFGPVGVAMALLTWCGIEGVAWVVVACTEAVVWERHAPAAVVVDAQRMAGP